MKCSVIKQGKAAFAKECLDQVTFPDHYSIKTIF